MQNIDLQGLKIICDEVKKDSPEIERRLSDRKKVEEESARMKDLEKLFVSLPTALQQERISSIKETMPFFEPM